MDHELGLIHVLIAVKISCECNGHGYCPACKVWNLLIKNMPTEKNEKHNPS
jgi:hypothetical protein